MSKYAPLKRYLEAQQGSQLPMTFAEVEQVLGFTLPSSARNHSPWWSNHVGTHVNAAAWRDAGWKTSGVDLGGERVTFVRDTAPIEPSPPGFSEGGAAWPAAEALTLGGLSRTARRMIDDWADESGSDHATAAAAILESVAAARRRQLLDRLPLAVMPPGFDSTEIIRAARDSR